LEKPLLGKVNEWKGDIQGRTGTGGLFEKSMTHNHNLKGRKFKCQGKSPVSHPQKAWVCTGSLSRRPGTWEKGKALWIISILQSMLQAMT